MTQAKGILMEREGLEPGAAFDRLVALADRRQLTLRELAAEVVASTGDARQPA